MTSPAIPRGSARLMAREAPSHFIRGCAGRIRHLFHVSVTGDTLKLMSQVPFVRKVHKVGESLEADPGHRRLLFPVLEQDFGLSGFCGKILMASHAELHGWDACGRGLFGESMAVEAIDLEAPRMQFVAEAQRLRLDADQVGASLRIEESDRDGQRSCHDEEGRRHQSRLGHGALAGC